MLGCCFELIQNSTKRTKPAFVAAEAVTVKRISAVPVSCHANAAPACVVGYLRPASVPIPNVFKIVAAPPTVSPTLMFVAPLPL